ncbi:MAG: flagellar export protein FliJ [Bdellovibrionaceae bacterium]|nr:flagellar export protein FliJ [Pseudobdellovibrionaceae bacterium]MBX3033057.1 flagellar export protein FliJ [Pseudobdellovibrionaceae bacterium]
MKFRFPLQKVLDHRHTLRDIAQKDFEEIQAEYLRQKNIWEEQIRALHEARLEAGRIGAESGPGAPERLKQIHEFSVLQEIRIQRQKAKVGEWEKLVEEKREILRQKAIDSKIMERLKERKKEQFVLDAKRAEQKEADELSVLRFEIRDDE